MYYIFANNTDKCVMSCNEKPNTEDIERNGMYIVENQEKHDTLSMLMCDRKTGEIYFACGNEKANSFSVAYNRAIKAIEDLKDRAPKLIDYCGIVYQIDEKSLQSFIVAKESMNECSHIQWISADNSIHDLTLHDVQSIINMTQDARNKYVMYVRGVKDDVNQVKVKHDDGKMDDDEAVRLLSGFIEEIEDMYNG